MKTNYSKDVYRLRNTLLNKIKELLDKSERKSFYNSKADRVLKIESAYSKYIEIWWYKDTMQFITWRNEMYPAVLVSCDDLGMILDILLNKPQKRNQNLLNNFYEKK